MRITSSAVMYSRDGSPETKGTWQKIWHAKSAATTSISDPQSLQPSPAVPPDHDLGIHSLSREIVIWENPRKPRKFLGIEAAFDNSPRLLWDSCDRRPDKYVNDVKSMHMCRQAGTSRHKTSVHCNRQPRDAAVQQDFDTPHAVEHTLVSLLAHQIVQG